jgi:hypothetical protein
MILNLNFEDLRLIKIRPGLSSGAFPLGSRPSLGQQQLIGKAFSQ